MPDLHYEFTGEVRRLEGTTLRCIRATKDLPHFGVLKGRSGGWIEHTDNLAGNAWVHHNACVYGNARVYGDALVYNDARVYGDALVYGNAHIYGHACVYDNAHVCGSARVSGDARVHGNAWVHGDARVQGEARVERPRHVLTVSPIGYEGVTATLHRTATGHALHVGYWGYGTLDELRAEVERRAAHWEGADQEKEAWRAQYDALYELGKATVKLWENE